MPSHVGHLRRGPARGHAQRRWPLARPRPRRRVGRVTLVVVSPLFRYSYRRDAYVLRGIGRRHGPVLTRRSAPAAKNAISAGDA
jgi:hypothetical protein